MKSSARVYELRLTVNALVAFSLQHLDSTHIFLQLDLQHLIFPAKQTEVPHLTQPCDVCPVCPINLRFFPLGELIKQLEPLDR